MVTHNVFGRSGGRVTLIRIVSYEVCLRGVHAERHRIRARFSLDSAHRSSFHLVCVHVSSSLRRGLPPMKGLSVILIISGCPKVDSCRGLTTLSHSVIGKHSV